MNATARKWGPAIITLAFAFAVFVIANLSVVVAPIVLLGHVMAMVVRAFV